MISKITLENFFSFKSPTTIELNQNINILLGINGSGKSNLLKAIQLLNESVTGQGLEKIFLKEWGGFNAVANFNGDKKDYIKLSFEFDKNAINNVLQQGFRFPHNPIYEIQIISSGRTSYFLKEKLYAKSARPGGDDYIYLEMDNAKGSISTRENRRISRQYYPQRKNQADLKSTELVLTQISDPDRFYPLFTLKRSLEEFSVYYHFDTTFNSPIRQPTSYGTEKKLLPNGQNLMAILSSMKTNSYPYYEKIEEAVKKINPYFRDIDFNFIGAKLYLVLRESHLFKSISIEHISDGTLRYLILLTVLFNPERGKLLCFDEPEISLHPDMINTVAEAIKEASKKSQLIIATHSPLLLNAFDIEDILIFEKDIHNETTVSIKSSEDFEDWVDDFLVGQAWMQGLIGGKRW